MIIMILFFSLILFCCFPWGQVGVPVVTGGGEGHRVDLGMAENSVILKEKKFKFSNFFQRIYHYYILRFAYFVSYESCRPQRPFFFLLSKDYCRASPEKGKKKKKNLKSNISKS
jgi:hypothetical protein